MSKARTVAQIEATKERKRAASRRYYLANREKVIAATRRWVQAHPEQDRERAYRRKYGITVAVKERMWMEQDKRCMICGDPLPSILSAHVDHCHITGQIRSLLCPHCNRGLGHFREDITRLQSAIDYLRRFMK